MRGPLVTSGRFPGAALCPSSGGGSTLQATRAPPSWVRGAPTGSWLCDSVSSVSFPPRARAGDPDEEEDGAGSRGGGGGGGQQAEEPGHPVPIAHPPLSLKSQIPGGKDQRSLQVELRVRFQKNTTKNKTLSPASGGRGLEPATPTPWASRGGRPPRPAASRTAHGILWVPVP